MAIKFRSTSTPELRNLYRNAYKIAKECVKGDKIMCPCGCLVQFKKESDSHVFYSKSKELNLNMQENKCKDRYHNGVRARTNGAYDERMLRVRGMMARYIHAYNKSAPAIARAVKIKKEPTSTEPIDRSVSSENFIAIMKQLKGLNQESSKNAILLCPCGCGDVFCKVTKQHAFSRKSGSDCKDNYYTLTRMETPIEMTTDRILSFKMMHASVDKILSLRTNELSTKKSTGLKRRR